jgi:hypothetical protein
LRGTGCQGFIGPIPSAFLDKKIKELGQSYIIMPNLQMIILLTELVKPNRLMSVKFD